jgi:hypothetical protein
VPTSTPACPHGTTFPSLFHAVTRHNVCPQTANSGQMFAELGCEVETSIELENVRGKKEIDVS